MSIILVTGGAGFIGSHVCERLLEENHVVLCLDNFDDYYDRRIKRNNIQEASDSARFHLIEADIRNYESLVEAVSKYKIDKVIHLAARPGVSISVKDPTATFTNNVIGTQNVLEMLREKRIQRLVYASSSSVYGSHSKGPFSEEQDTSFPESPYAASKKMGEMMAYAYHRVFGFDVVCLRFFTVYGPRQRPDMAIHHFVRLTHEKDVLPVYGPPTSMRDYTYIDDAVECVIRSMSINSGYEVLNIGGGRPVLLRDLMKIIIQAVGKDCRINWLPKRIGDVPVTHADTRKVRRVLGYVPVSDIVEGTRRFVEWYKEVHEILQGEDE